MPQDADFVKRYRTYKLWSQQLDRELQKLCGMTMDCLPDYATWDAWSRGEDPAETAVDVIENAKEY